MQWGANQWMTAEFEMKIHVQNSAVCCVFLTSAFSFVRVAGRSLLFECCLTQRANFLIVFARSAWIWWFRYAAIAPGLAFTITGTKIRGQAQAMDTVLCDKCCKSCFSCWVLHSNKRAFFNLPDTLFCEVAHFSNFAKAHGFFKTDSIAHFENWLFARF